MNQRVTVEVEHRPDAARRRSCSLLDGCMIEPGTGADFQSLARYHYRHAGFPPGCKQIYRARYTPEEIVVGAIVYTVPALQLSARNRATGGIYAPGKRTLVGFMARKVNAEVELIMRVVVHPTFRGVGLGRRLIAETLTRRPVRYVEMSAAMGAVNPFAEQAGMTPYEMPPGKETARILAALRSVGITDAEIPNPSVVLAKIRALPDGRRQWIESRLRIYEEFWMHARSNRKLDLCLEATVTRVAGNAMLRPRYFLWANPDWLPQHRRG